MKGVLTIVLCFVLTGLLGQTVNDLRPTVTMKEYVDMQIDWSQKYNNAQLQSLEKASELVRISLQEYKTVNNEWRGQLRDQSRTFVTWTSLIGLIFGVAGLIFGYANYRKSQQQNGGKNIQSGDNVVVKK